MDGEVLKTSDLSKIQKQRQQEKISQERKKSFVGIREAIGILKIVNPTPKKLIVDGVLNNGAWSGRRCFIIGGGPSLKNFNFSQLEGELTIGINRAYEKIDPNILFFSDVRFWGWVQTGVFGQEAKQRFHYTHAVKVALKYTDFPYPENVQIVHTAPDKEILTSDIKQGIVFGDNSGYAAINLAVCLGANPIYLLGFDMHGNTQGKQENWHDGYPEEADAEAYKDLIEKFDIMAPVAAARGVQIINLSQESELKCFPVKKFEDIKNEKPALYMEGYAGIGDNFWQRPFIRELCLHNTLYLMTYTPQIYWDIENIKFVRTPYDAFKSHNAIADTFKDWVEKPANTPQIRPPEYWVGFRHGLTLPEQFEKVFPIEKYDFSFPVKNEWVQAAQKVIGGLDIPAGKKICLVRFPVTRKEWKCPAREPKPEYIQMLIDKYKDEYYFISLADMRQDNESFEVEPKNIDKAFHHGELDLTTIFGLIKLSDMVITGNCFLLGTSIAIGARTFALYGGTQHPDLYIDKRMDLSKYAQVYPEPFCECFLSDHDCFKDIPEEKIINTFEELKNRPDWKKNLLIYKVGPRYHHGFRQNNALNAKYNLFFEQDIDDFEKYLQENNINAVISVDYPPEKTRAICNRLGINWIFNEAFLGVKNVFDRRGPHFTPDNEIEKYVGIVDVSKADLPKQTKIAQPPEISKEELFKKYGLSNDDKHIVIMGQEVDDKSLIYSRNKDIKSYADYICFLAMNNLDAKFIFKPHPVYKTTKRDTAHLIDFVYNYKNVIPVDENIDSLFKAFDYFTAFSSTTILEGLIRGKIFATCGYHFLSGSGLIMELKTEQDFSGLYKRFEAYSINAEKRHRYLNFLCNYYAIDPADPKLVDRIERTSKGYFEEVYQ